MGVIAAAIVVFCLLVPGVATGQTSTHGPAPPDGEGERRHHLSLQVAAGPTLTLAGGGGNVLSAAFGYSPASWLELLVNLERNHVPFQLYGGATRGGTLTFVSAELRLALRRPDRVTPFAMAGVGSGVSRPNVNAVFPDSVSNNLRVLYVGGGVRVPLRRGFSLLGDVRCMLGLEGYDGVLAVWPVRAGIAWRF